MVGAGSAKMCRAWAVFAATDGCMSSKPGGSASVSGLRFRLANAICSARIALTTGLTARTSSTGPGSRIVAAGGPFSTDSAAAAVRDAVTPSCAVITGEVGRATYAAATIGTVVASSAMAKLRAGGKRTLDRANAKAPPIVDRRGFISSATGAPSWLNGYPTTESDGRPRAACGCSWVTTGCSTRSPLRAVVKLNSATRVERMIMSKLSGSVLRDRATIR